MNPLNTEGCSVVGRFEDRQLRITLTGTFDVAVATQLGQCFREVQAEARSRRSREVILDVTEVYYLGSSCIKVFVALTANLKAAPFSTMIRVITNPRLDWQFRTFQALARLAPGHVTIESK